MPGSITFRPIEANLTHNTEWIGKMDPYVQFLVGDHKVRTNVCRKGGKHPMWDDNVTIPFTSENCLVEIKDKDLIKDDRIGSFEINLGEIESQGTLKKWYPIFHRDKPAGEILMEATFCADQGFQQPLGGAPMMGGAPLMNSTVPLMTQSNLPLQTPGLIPTQGSKSLSEQFAEEALLRSIDPLHTHSANLNYNLPTGTGPLNDVQKDIPVNTAGGYPHQTSLQGLKLNQNQLPTQHNQFVPVGTGLGADYLTNNVTEIAHNMGSQGYHAHHGDQMTFGHGHYGTTVVKESLNATTQGPVGTANTETFDRKVKNI